MMPPRKPADVASAPMGGMPNMRSTSGILSYSHTVGVVTPSAEEGTVDGSPASMAPSILGSPDAGPQNSSSSAVTLPFASSPALTSASHPGDIADQARS